MRFDFTEDQRLLQQTVRDFLAGECTPESIRGLWTSETGRSRALWKQLAEVGLVGLLALRRELLIRIVPDLEEEAL